MNSRRQLLSDALVKVKAFHEKWRQLNESLSGVENKMYADWVPHGLPKPCEGDLAEHQVRAAHLLHIQPRRKGDVRVVGGG